MLIGQDFISAVNPTMNDEDSSHVPKRWRGRWSEIFPYVPVRYEEDSE